MKIKVFTRHFIRCHSQYSVFVETDLSKVCFLCTELMFILLIRLYLGYLPLDIIIDTMSFNFCSRCKVKTFSYYTVFSCLIIRDSYIRSISI